MRRIFAVRLWMLLAAIAIVAIPLGILANRWRRGGFEFQRQEYHLAYENFANVMYCGRVLGFMEDHLKFHLSSSQDPDDTRLFCDHNSFLLERIRGLKSLEDQSAHPLKGHDCPICHVEKRPFPELIEEVKEVQRKYQREFERHRAWAGPFYREQLDNPAWVD